MEFDTKLKFGNALKEMSKEKSLNKVTVNNIVERGNMTRQAFYYHFHDMYELVEWVCRYELVQKKKDSERGTFEEWTRDLVFTLDKERIFYKKVIRDFDERLLEHILEELIQRKLEDTLWVLKMKTKTQKEEDYVNFIIHFLTISYVNYLNRWLLGTDSCEKEEVVEQLSRLVEDIQSGYMRRTDKRWIRTVEFV